MDNHTLDQIIRISELCSSISESIQYYALQKSNKALLQNTFEALHAVKTSQIMAGHTSNSTDVLSNALNSPHIACWKMMACSGYLPQIMKALFHECGNSRTLCGLNHII